jgi:hypothetical protein
MWPPPFLWHTTTGQCWPGVLKLYNKRCLGSKGEVARNSKGKYFFRESCAIMPPSRGFGFKNRSFRGFFPGLKVIKSCTARSSKGYRIISVLYPL